MAYQEQFRILHTSVFDELILWIGQFGGGK